MNVDIAVIGAGTMGSSAAYHLARRGKKVVVFDRYEPVNTMGSHGGYTRIIRHAYFESPDYVPLVFRSDELWQQLEKDQKQTLLIRTGCLDMGPEDGAIYAGAMQACIKHSIPHEQLQPDEAMRRWPQFKIPLHWKICFDPSAGFLIVPLCIRAHLSEAAKHGAQIRTPDPVIEVDYSRSPIHIRAASGSYYAEKAVICSGAWNLKLLADLKLPMHIQRQPVGWFEITRNHFDPAIMPVYLADTPDGVFYGFPVFQHQGLKVARHGAGRRYEDADIVDRVFHDSDADELRSFTSKYLRGVGTKIVEGIVCLYTMTPDEHFIIDLHPENPDVVITAGFSGHGFKFAPVVGEIAADLCLLGKTSQPVDTFRISRFVKQ